MIGGFLKIVFGKGWFCIRLQCSINVFNCRMVRCDNRQYPLVTFLLLCKCRLSRGKVDPWQRPFYDVFWVPSCFEALFEFQKALFKCFFRRVSSKQSYCFAFNETIFYAWWVARGEVRELEGLGRLVVSFDVQDGIFCESFPFEHCGIEESDLVLWYFGREFDSRVEFVSLLNKPIYVFSVAIPKGESVIKVVFPFFWLGTAL